MKTETQQQYDDGHGCECHASPPCDFCISMTEEEFEAYADDGINGLEALWEANDEEGEEAACQ